VKRAWVLVLAMAGCSAPSGSAATGPTASPVVDERGARSVAEQKARESGYDTARYRIVSVERADEGSLRGKWRVFFEQLPPTPPGGHFNVYVDSTSGEAQIFHGK
jgi:hypothetical protein